MPDSLIDKPSSPSTAQATGPSAGPAEVRGNESPYLFAVGCPRSGTTLLQRMLDAHSQLAVANDSHFIPRVLEKHEPQVIENGREGNPISLTESMVRGALDYHRFYRLGLDRNRVLAAGVRAESYQQFVQLIYEAYAAEHRAQWAGEKTPDYVRHLDLLNGMFPSAHILHIVRDGRDVALSLQGWAHKKKGPGRLDLWDSEPVGTSALWWQWLLQAGRRSAQGRPDMQYLEIHYERLARDPTELLRHIADFLGVPYEAEMAEFHRGRQVASPGLSAKSAWSPATPGLRNWRNQMESADVALFEVLAGPTLEAFGYELTGLPVDGSIQRRAEICLNWWQNHMETDR